MKYKMPIKSNLRTRTSTISNAFTISITPYIKPTQDEIEKLLRNLDVKDGQCVYCMRPANSTDHFRPLVKDGLPNGYISDINNLVPFCSECNSSKGKKDWDEWYCSAKNKERLKSFGLNEDQIEHRYNVLQNYATSTQGNRIDYQSLLGTEKWEEFKNRKASLNERLKEEQQFCDAIRKEIEKKLKQ